MKGLQHWLSPGDEREEKYPYSVFVEYAGIHFREPARWGDAEVLAEPIRLGGLSFAALSFETDDRGILPVFSNTAT